MFVDYKNVQNHHEYWYWVISPNGPNETPTFTTWVGATPSEVGKRVVNGYSEMIQVYPSIL